MLEMNDYGNTARIAVNSTELFLSIDEIAQTYCQLAVGFDICEKGSARVSLGPHIVELTGRQRYDLYQFTDQFLNKVFQAAEMEAETLH